MALRRNLISRSLQAKHLHGLAVRTSLAAPPELPPFDYVPKPYNGPSADEVLAKRKKFLGPSLFYYYQKPLLVIFTFRRAATLPSPPAGPQPCLLKPPSTPLPSGPSSPTAGSASSTNLHGSSSSKLTSNGPSRITEISNDPHNPPITGSAVAVAVAAHALLPPAGSQPIQTFLSLSASH
ncbi:hypothetical protein TEA_015615 [Camellia sinensis var. sinensis]|uniref:Uncharacterized protein n=1 Tax=Camellia sinensis var. sinensis TaxID=542762 RepID=A0A4S4E4F5_CAMSN|nr:hypothetical protein TEA_015615 [Camellia sinensis var. sinensis]